MLHLVTGTDREKVLHATQQIIDAASKHGARIVRLSDAHTRADVHENIQGGGLFAEKRVVVFDNLWSVPELKEVVRGHLASLKKSSDVFVIVEEKIEAAERKVLEKQADTSEKYDAAKKEKESFNIFSLANALRSGNKKDLWVGYQRALVTSAPEAIHGILFWGAKDMYMKARTEGDRVRASALITTLVALPHESRRRGVELEYALEQFVLSKV